MEQKNIQREWEQILFCESFVLIVHIFANVCVHTHMYVLWCKMCFLLLVTVKNIECLLPMDLYLNIYIYSLLIDLVFSYLPNFILYCPSHSRPAIFQIHLNMSYLCTWCFLQSWIYFLLCLPIKLLSIFKIHLICHLRREIFSSPPPSLPQVKLIIFFFFATTQDPVY